MRLVPTLPELVEGVRRRPACRLSGQLRGDRPHASVVGRPGRARAGHHEENAWLPMWPWPRPKRLDQSTAGWGRPRRTGPRPRRGRSCRCAGVGGPHAGDQSKGECSESAAATAVSHGASRMFACPSAEVEVWPVTRAQHRRFSSRGYRCSIGSARGATARDALAGGSDGAGSARRGSARPSTEPSRIVLLLAGA